MTDHVDNPGQRRERVPWSEAELSVIVDVYLQMLELEAASQPYVKAEYNREVQSRTGRGRGSVEYKFQNISHVLNEARHKFVEGYKPAANVQAALRAMVLKRISGTGWDSSSRASELPILNPSADAPAPDYRRRYAGTCLDPLLRKAVEQAAVRQATRHYEGLGYRVEDVGLTHSYDLRVVRNGEERHVEVKGSQIFIEKIQLTRNEVLHAEEFENTDLVLVREVPWERSPDGTITAGFGLMEVRSNWCPSQANLRPTSYEYRLD